MSAKFPRWGGGGGVICGRKSTSSHSIIYFCVIVAEHFEIMPYQCNKITKTSRVPECKWNFFSDQLIFVAASMFLSAHHLCCISMLFFDLYILNDKRNLTCFPLTRKVQILETNKNANFTCRTSKMFSKKTYLSGMKYDVRLCQICHISVCLKEFSKTLFMFVRPVIEQTKVHFKILELLVITLGTRR